ncbi:MAG: ABC transporter substrate-binding protein [Amphritea sp.]
MHNQGSGQGSGLNRLYRRRFLQLAVRLGAAALFAWPGTASYGQQPGDRLRIGIMGPFTGPASRTGRAIRQGVIMALEDARAEGEVPVSIEGEKLDIELVWVDSASYPDTAVKAVTRAVTQQGVQILIGGWHSAVALAVMEAEAQYRILHFANLGAAQTIANRLQHASHKYPGWFKGSPAPAKLAALYGEPLQYFQEQGLWQPANNKAAVMVEDTAFGHSWGDALLDSLRQAGFDPLPYDLTALEQTDFRTLLDKYNREQVSLVAITTTGSVAAANFVKQFRQQEIKALLLGHGLRWFDEWYEMTGASSDFVISMDSPMPMALWQQWWVRRYTERFKQPPSIQAAGLHYDYTRMAIKVLNSATVLDLNDLAATIYRTPYRGVWNHYRFVRDGDSPEQTTNEVLTGKFMEGFFLPMVQLFGGQAKTIWPTKYADQHFRAPPWI